MPAIDEQAFRNLISGRKQGWTAAVLRTLLHATSLAYATAVRCRNALFDRGLLTVAKVGVPVISIGNLTTGGTGKTPVAAFLCDELLRLGLRPGLISRGYRATGSQGNDEKQVLEQLVPEVPHIQNPHRLAAARDLLQLPPTQRPNVIVMDDGLQHRRLHRDLNLVLIDVTCPFGFGFLLPRGLLREPVNALRRADAVLLTRCRLASQTQLAELESTLLQIAPQLNTRILHVDFQPTGLRHQSGLRKNFADFHGQPVFLLSGIGNPAAFEATCKEAGLQIAGTRWFPDHHHFTPADLAATQSEADRRGAQAVITTLKDLVKLSPQHNSLFALDIEARLPRTADQQTLRLLLQHVTRPNKS